MFVLQKLRPIAWEKYNWGSLIPSWWKQVNWHVVAYFVTILKSFNKCLIVPKSASIYLWMEIGHSPTMEMVPSLDIIHIGDLLPFDIHCIATTHSNNSISWQKCTISSDGKQCVKVKCCSCNSSLVPGVVIATRIPLPATVVTTNHHDSIHLYDFPLHELKKCTILEASSI